MLLTMNWGERSEIARYPYGGSKKRAQRRIHKIERQQTRAELHRAPWHPR